MHKIKSVGVKELKNKLSAYLREAAAGTKILVTDRGEVIAELGRPGFSSGNDAATEAFLRWKELGQIRFPRKAKSKLGDTGLKNAEGLSKRLIEEDRGE